ncbi:MAG: glycosyltransferase family 2 protein, partial [Lachnospiraceae bacterium]|nr:glycosyltransferase family 2 protein [Lachnospiraceae bacterium]
MNKISVIIPMYNSQDYIGQCLRSVISQTYRNLEVLVIDDGSTDKSVEICQS